MKHNEEIFEDSDTDYVDLENEKPSKKRKIIASPRVSKQMRKAFGGEANGVSYTKSPSKSPRNLKQQLTFKSPARRSLNLDDKTPEHVPLTLDKRKDPNHIPYYLLNFECILRGVINETDDKELFLDSELAIVNDFWEFSLDAKKTFVRLFQRKHAWILERSISYDEIQSQDIQLKFLVSKKFLQSGSDLDDLETVLNILPAPAVKQLCKNMNLGVKANHKKEDGVSALLAHSKKRSIFAVSSKSGMGEIILKKARALIEGGVYKVSDEIRKIFMRILSLYSLSNWWEDRESERGQQANAPQLTTILLQNTGKITFPVYKIIRQRKIFRSRDDLLRFESICTLETELSESMNEKDWDKALELTQEAMNQFDKLLDCSDTKSHASSLPDFLKKFTSGSVLVYILNKGVEVYEKVKNYKKAVELLRKLIDQNDYLPDYHGHWYERLVLDLDQHLKSPKEALEAIKSALSDHHCQEARLLSLCQRVNKITSAKKNGVKLSLMEMQEFTDHKRWLTPQDPKLVTIQGKMMPKSNLPGEKTVFLVEGATEGENDLLCSVEEYVKEHYKRNRGYTNGLHAEGSICHAIAAILFWDIIYETEVPDVFRSPQQSTPLDYNSPHFYAARREKIEDRLTQLAVMPSQKLCDMVTARWESCCQISACLVNWELFTSLNHFLSLIKCFSNAQLSGLCRRLMTNHRHTRSGFPDLTLWDVQNQRVAFVEVKGPNDRLSNKQILWLDYLCSLGLEALVCHIEPINAKKLPTSRKKATSANLSNDSDDDFQ